MSIVAWDGAYLVADKQATCSGMKVTVSKARRLATGEVVAWTGDQEQGLALAKWYEEGADPAKWPEFQKKDGDNWTRLIVADSTGVSFFEKQPERQRVEDKFMAWGSGRDYAMGAMQVLRDAVKAVEVASMFDVHCGRGMEVFCLGKGQ